MPCLRLPLSLECWTWEWSPKWPENRVLCTLQKLVACLGQAALLWEIASAWPCQEFLKLRHLEGL